MLICLQNGILFLFNKYNSDSDLINYILMMSTQVHYTYIYSTRGADPPLFNLRFGHSPISVQINLQHFQAQLYIICTLLIMILISFQIFIIKHMIVFIILYLFAVNSYISCFTLILIYEYFSDLSIQDGSR